MSTRILRLLTENLGTLDLANEHISAVEASDFGLTDEASFTRMIALERMRTARSSRPFLLMLIEGRESLCPVNGHQDLLRRLVGTLRNVTRETDSVGWYKKDRVVGVIFTEVGALESSTMAAISAKIVNALRSHLSQEQMAELKISLHRYPEEDQPPQNFDHLAMYPDLASGETKNKAGHIVKRILDIAGSALLLVLLAPLILVIALAIKLTSRGPVFFKQERVGQYGMPFTFLKFRSMHVNNDPRIHKEYVSKLISCDKGGERRGDSEAGGVYKITRDPRVTAVGKFLRKSSLDELPQLWNVLRGEMSLVGPRPPIPYEFECYDVWHRRRVLVAKPGITGLWQVTGRSRTCFDEMVRLDLRYATNWSIWLDLKILLKTPAAVLSGDGAY